MKQNLFTIKTVQEIEGISGSAITTKEVKL